MSDRGRVVHVVVGPQSLLALMQPNAEVQGELPDLPEGTRVVAIHVDPRTMDVVLTLEHELFPMAQEGGLPITLTRVWARTCRRQAQVAPAPPVGAEVPAG